MTVSLRLIGPEQELHELADQLRTVPGVCVHIDTKRRAGEGWERWYGDIHLPDWSGHRCYCKDADVDPDPVPAARAFATEQPAADGNGGE
jgi:hypothetical protein